MIVAAVFLYQCRSAMDYYIVFMTVIGMAFIFYVIIKYEMYPKC